VTLAEPPGSVTGIDTDGTAVAWTSGSDDEQAGYLLVHDEAYRLAGDVVEAAVAGDRLAWVTTDPAGSDPRLHLARIQPVDR